MGERRYDNGSGSRRGDSSLPPVPTSHDRSARSSFRNREPSGGRIYVGNLPNNCDRKTVDEVFGPFGKIREISIKRTISGSPFAFVEYEDARDARDAIREKDGFKLDDCVLRVEVPFAARQGGNKGPSSRGRKTAGPPRRAEFRVAVKGLPPSGSWQDLKDHMREAGDCVYADVYRDGTGVVEFARREDMEFALRNFGGSKFRSHEGESSHITVTKVKDDDMDRGRYDDRRSMERSRYRSGRSVSDWDHGRSYDRGYDVKGYTRSYERNYDRRDGGGSYSRGRRSLSYDRSRSRSRSHRRR